MTKAMRHRGPDDDGYYRDGSTHLAMVRLSIIDLASGHQPMTEEGKRYWIVFNGEIYNYQSLREQLESRGHRFTSRADTEVIVHLYEEIGTRCVEQLNGDFAFAIWDTVEKRLFLARDRLGVKPLYYWHHALHFAFASELKSLLGLPEVSRELDPQALDAYLTYLYVPAPRSIFRGIRKLPPATWLMFERDAVRTERYWSLPAPRRSGKLAASLAPRILEQLKEAVRLRLMSDVSLGAFLSGGIDSSAVVALMSQCTSQPVRTFSIGFGRPYESYNELPSARIVAKAFQTNHHEFVVTPDITSLLPQMVWHMDEPFADSSALLTFLISREAKQEVTVALTGIGGDEVFGGYPRYLGAWISMAYERIPSLLRGIASKAAGSFPESTKSRNLVGWAKRFTSGGLEPRDVRYLRWVSSLSGAGKQALYTPALLAALDDDDAYADYRAILNSAPGDYLDQINALDLQTYLPDDLLTMGDKMSMAHGLEVRVPFCDHHLVEMVAAIPLRQRLDGFRLKSLLKDAVRPLLPPELLRKRKQGFMAPIGAWLKSDLQPLCRELLSPSAVERRGMFRPEAVTALVTRHAHAGENLTHQIYALLVLELWFRQYLDG